MLIADLSLYHSCEILIQQGNFQPLRLDLLNYKPKVDIGTRMGLVYNGFSKQAHWFIVTILTD